MKTTDPILNHTKQHRTGATHLVVLGLLLLLAAVGCVVGAGVYSAMQPRLFPAATEFQLLVPAEDAARLPVAFEQAKKEFPKAMNQPLTAEVDLRAKEFTSDLYRITALDRDPRTAANTVNFLTMSVADALRAGRNDDVRRVEVRVKGEMAKKPSKPDVAAIMRTGMLGAAALGIAGGWVLWSGLNRPRGGRAVGGDV